MGQRYPNGDIAFSAFREIDPYGRDVLVIGIDESVNGDAVVGLVASWGRAFKFLSKRQFRDIKHYTEITKTTDRCGKAEYICKFYRRFEKTNQKNSSFEYYTYYAGHNIKERMGDDIINLLSLPATVVIFIVDDHYISFVRDYIMENLTVIHINHDVRIKYFSGDFTDIAVMEVPSSEIRVRILIIREGFLHKYLVGTRKIFYDDLYKFQTIADNLANYFRFIHNKKNPCTIANKPECKKILKARKQKQR